MTTLMNDANNAARPVAFRVLKHRLSSGYDIYDNEDDAQFLAGERGVSYEGLYLVSDRNTWDCAARKQSLPEPADCDWPTCGCDPYADKVIASLEESGIDLSTPNASVEQREVIANLVRMFIGTEVALVACGTRYKARPFDALIDAILAVRLDEAAIRKDEREKQREIDAKIADAMPQLLPMSPKHVRGLRGSDVASAIRKQS